MLYAVAHNAADLMGCKLGWKPSSSNSASNAPSVLAGVRPKRRKASSMFSREKGPDPFSLALSRKRVGTRGVVRRVAGLDHAFHAQEVGVHLALRIGAEDRGHRVAESAGRRHVG